MTRLSLLKRKRTVPMRWYSSYSLAVATIVAWWLRYLGPNDYEERPTFGYLFGETAREGRDDELTSAFGRADVLNVPQFDLRQGLGVRLPIAGSWTQSPWVLVRAAVSESNFYFLRNFVATFAMLWALNYTIEMLSTRGKFYWRAHVISLSALGHVALFNRYTDWTVASSFNSTLVALTCAIINWSPSATPRAMRQSHWLPVIAIYSALEIGTGHPGWIFFALLVAASTWYASRKSFWFETRKLLPRNKLWKDWLPLTAILIIATNAMVVLLDLANEFEGTPQSAFSQGLSGLADPLFVLEGISRGLIPGWLEELGSQIFFGAFAPVLWLFSNFLPDSNVLRYSANLFPRGWFPNLSALAALLALRATRNRESRDRLNLVVVPSLVAVGYSLLQEWKLVVPFLRTSGTWITSGALRILLTLGLLVNFSSRARTRPRALHSLFAFSLLVSIIYSLSMLDSVKRSEDTEFSSPSRIFSRSDTQFHNFKIGARLGSRIIASGSERHLNSTLQFLQLRGDGFQVVAPMFVKNRSTAPVAALPPTSGMFLPSPEELRRSMMLNEGRTFDFLNIEAIYLEHNPFGSDIDNKFNVLPTNSKVELQGVLYSAFSHHSFSTFYLPTNTFEQATNCEILRDFCEPLVLAVRGPSQVEPRFQLCVRDCLARFRYDLAEPVPNSLVVLPVKFDSAIEARLAGSEANTTTQNVSGFLGVRITATTSGEILLDLRPELLLVARSVLTYLNSLILVVAIIYALFRNRISQIT